MNAQTAKEYSNQDWQKLASDAETKVEGRLFINCEYCEAADGGKFEVLNPSTNEVFATASEGTEKDVDRAVAAAKESFRSEAFIQIFICIS